MSVNYACKSCFHVKDCSCQYFLHRSYFTLKEAKVIIMNGLILSVIFARVTIIDNTLEGNSNLLRKINNG